MQQAVELGVESMVGRPLLYQAHASTAAPTLIGRGEQQEPTLACLSSLLARFCRAQSALW